MPRYIVDLSCLESEEKISAFNLLKNFSFLAVPITGVNGIEAVDVIWTSSSDFETSPVFPKGCPCKLIAY